MKKGTYINDSIHGLIELSEYESRIISSIGFNRLHDVYQNSTVYLTFPSNRTKRFEHSIGTMELCSKMFFRSVLNSKSEEITNMYNAFGKEIEDVIREIGDESKYYELKLGGVSPNKDKLPNISFDKLRCSITPSNIGEKYRVIHLILIESIRVSALLHDVGHPPFSHIVEFALRDEYNKIKTEANNSRKKSFIETMDFYFKDKKKLHEQMGDIISENILKDVIKNIDQDDVEFYDENLFELIVLICVKRIFKNEGLFADLHKIVDSSLDGDRLDYVTRDSVNSGMNAGKIDYNRIINDMKVISEAGHFYFCIPLKAVNTVEDFLKRRFNIYKDIVNHHRVVKTDYLLQDVVRKLVEKYLEEDSKESEGNEKSGEMIIPFDISGLWAPLPEKMSVTQRGNALSQWNDAWLMTVLKQIYYKEYYRKKEMSKPNIVLSQELSELLRNKKCYYSLIKRSENFKTIDDGINKCISDNRENIEKLINQLQETSDSMTFKSDDNKIKLSIEATLNAVQDLLKNIPGFKLWYIIRRKEIFERLGFDIQQVKKIVEDSVINILGEEKVMDTVVVFKKISNGLDTDIPFYNYKNRLVDMKQISRINEILELESDYLPVFYIYILMKKEYDLKEERYNVLKEIGDKTGKYIVTVIRKNFIKLLENNMEME